ncbi:MAG: hypothetical protein IPL40_04040 [Proteobacteria bacterium]|nr:hypothetical protein [Pseudomonadota bacterium]
MSGARPWLVRSNALLLISAGLALALAHGRVGGASVGPLVAGGPLVQRRLVELKRDLARWPADLGRALQLAQLLIHAGLRQEARDVLRALERRMAPEPLLQLELVAAYAELDWPLEALRSLRAAVARCAVAAVTCGSGDRARLELALQAGELMLVRGDAPPLAAADRSPALRSPALRPRRDLWREVFKPARAGSALGQPRPRDAASQ